MLERLERVIMLHVTDATLEVANSLESFSACAGIKEDPDNAKKAIWNHYGHPTKGRWAEPREYITNATGNGGTHKSMPNMELALQRVVMETIKNTVRRKQNIKGMSTPTEGSTKTFGTTNSPRKIMKAIADQMLINQMVALGSVTPKNTEATLAHKKKRSDQPLIDYGRMKAATRRWVEYEGEEM